jgi:hypothetical protein
LPDQCCDTVVHTAVFKLLVDSLPRAA